MTVSCDVIKDLLPLYAEDMVSSDSRKLVDEHLVECVQCRSRLEDIQWVQKVPAVAVDAELASIQRVEKGEKQGAVKCLGCLAKCDRASIPYCISRALLAAVKGDWENGLFFCGANAGDKTALTTVEQEIDQIVTEWRNAR